MRLKTILLSLFLTFFSVSFATPFKEISKVEHYLVQELRDSLNLYIPKIQDKTYRDVVKRIASDNGSYKDFLIFLPRLMQILFYRPETNFQALHNESPITYHLSPFIQR
jgi:hypothetical protein